MQCRARLHWLRDRYPFLRLHAQWSAFEEVATLAQERSVGLIVRLL